jgi:hypothetical protein
MQGVFRVVWLSLSIAAENMQCLTNLPMVFCHVRSQVFAYEFASLTSHGLRIVIHM